MLVAGVFHEHELKAEIEWALNQEYWQRVYHHIEALVTNGSPKRNENVQTSAENAKLPLLKHNENVTNGEKV